MKLIEKILTRISYWVEKQTDSTFMWGHPDEWSDAEYYYWEKERRKKNG